MEERVLSFISCWTVKLNGHQNNVLATLRENIKMLMANQLYQINTDNTSFYLHETIII